MEKLVCIVALVLGLMSPLTADVQHPLPASADKTLLSQDGNFLIMKFASIHRISIFSIKANKFVKHIKVGSGNPLFAVGGRALLIYHPKTQVFEMWSLKSLKKVVSKKYTHNSNIVSITMGKADAKKALLTVAATGNSAAYLMMKVPSCEVMKLNFKAVGYDSSLRVEYRRFQETPQIYANDSGTKFLCVEHFDKHYITYDNVKSELQFRSLGRESVKGSLSQNGSCIVSKLGFNFVGKREVKNPQGLSVKYRDLYSGARNRFIEISSYNPTKGYNLRYGSIHPFRYSKVQSVFKGEISEDWNFAIASSKKFVSINNKNKLIYIYDLPK